MTCACLDFSGYHLCDDELGESANALTEGEYEELDFSFNYITAVGFARLHSCINAKQLRVVKLHKNCLDDAAAGYLASLCKTSPCLAQLHISHNRLTASGVKEIVAARTDAARDMRSSQPPLWLRVNMNWVRNPASLLEAWAVNRVPVCSLKAKCTSSFCVLHACVHLPLFRQQRERIERTERSENENREWTKRTEETFAISTETEAPAVDGEEDEWPDEDEEYYLPEDREDREDVFYPDTPEHEPIGDYANQAHWPSAYHSQAYWPPAPQDTEWNQMAYNLDWNSPPKSVDCDDWCPQAPKPEKSSASKVTYSAWAQVVTRTAPRVIVKLQREAAQLPEEVVRSIILGPSGENLNFLRDEHPGALVKFKFNGDDEGPAIVIRASASAKSPEDALASACEASKKAEQDARDLVRTVRPELKAAALYYLKTSHSTSNAAPEVKSTGLVSQEGHATSQAEHEGDPAGNLPQAGDCTEKTAGSTDPGAPHESSTRGDGAAHLKRQGDSKADAHASVTALFSACSKPRGESDTAKKTQAYNLLGPIHPTLKRHILDIAESFELETSCANLTSTTAEADTEGSFHSSMKDSARISDAEQATLTEDDDHFIDREPLPEIDIDDCDESMDVNDSDSDTSSEQPMPTAWENVPDGERDGIFEKQLAWLRMDASLQSRIVELVEEPEDVDVDESESTSMNIEADVRYNPSGDSGVDHQESLEGQEDELVVYAKHTDVLTAMAAEEPRIVHRDDGFLVLFKPPRCLCSAHQQDSSLGVASYLQESGIGAGSALCHRLDRATSGLLLVGTEEDATRDLMHQRNTNLWRNDYVCLMHGWLPEGHIEGSVQFKLKTCRDGKGFKTVVDEHDGSWAETRYAVLQHYRCRTSQRPFTLLGLRITTGCTHQIRVHVCALAQSLGLAHCGIVGDAKYSSSLAFASDLALFRRASIAGQTKVEPRLCLHACALAFRSHRTSARIGVRCSLPPDLLSLIQLTLDIDTSPALAAGEVVQSLKWILEDLTEEEEVSSSTAATITEQVSATAVATQVDVVLQADEKSHCDEAPSLREMVWIGRSLQKCLSKTFTRWLSVSRRNRTLVKQSSCDSCMADGAVLRATFDWWVGLCSAAPCLLSAHIARSRCVRMKWNVMSFRLILQVFAKQVVADSVSHRASDDTQIRKTHTQMESDCCGEDEAERIALALEQQHQAKSDAEALCDHVEKQLAELKENMNEADGAELKHMLEDLHTYTRTDGADLEELKKKMQELQETSWAAEEKAREEAATKKAEEVMQQAEAARAAEEKLREEAAEKAAEQAEAAKLAEEKAREEAAKKVAEQDAEEKVRQEAAKSDAEQEVAAKVVEEKAKKEAALEAAKMAAVDDEVVNSSAAAVRPRPSRPRGSRLRKSGDEESDAFDSDCSGSSESEADGRGGAASSNSDLDVDLDADRRVQVQPENGETCLQHTGTNETGYQEQEKTENSACDDEEGEKAEAEATAVACQNEEDEDAELDEIAKQAESTALQSREVRDDAENDDQNNAHDKAALPCSVFSNDEIEGSTQGSESMEQDICTPETKKAVPTWAWLGDLCSPDEADKECFPTAPRLPRGADNRRVNNAQAEHPEEGPKQSRNCMGDSSENKYRARNGRDTRRTRLRQRGSSNPCANHCTKLPLGEWQDNKGAIYEVLMDEGSNNTCTVRTTRRDGRVQETKKAIRCEYVIYRHCDGLLQRVTWGGRFVLEVTADPDKFRWKALNGGKDFYWWSLD